MTSQAITSEIQKLAPSAVIELFVLDLSLFNEGVVRFHAGTNELRRQVVWQGNTYEPFPIQAEGFEFNGNGQVPRPKLKVANVTGTITALILSYQDLVGAKVTRKRTLLKYLDAVNFPGGVNALADPTAAYPDELWIFDRVRSRDGEHVAWELVSPFDLEDVMLPARQVRNAICGSVYRSSECGYTGGPVATADDVPTSNTAQDQCSLRVSGCKLRFGASAELPIDFFPGAGTVRQM